MGEYVFNFEKLEVWQLSIKLSIDIYTQTRNFPSDEKFGLTAQIRRASTSIAANLAEGSSRLLLKEQIRFTNIAYSSLMELLNHLIVANALGYLTTDNLNTCRDKIKTIAIKINNLKNSQVKRLHETN